MASQALRAEALVALLVPVGIVHLGPVVLVAAQAGELAEVTGHHLAGAAVGPFTPVLAAVDLEEPGVVIEGRAFPPHGRVARGAVGWDACGLVGRSEVWSYAAWWQATQSAGVPVYPLLVWH
jgi:hypothetical protein